MTSQRDASSDVIRHRFHHNVSHEENSERLKIRASALVHGFKGTICKVFKDDDTFLTRLFFFVHRFEKAAQKKKEERNILCDTLSNRALCSLSGSNFDAWNAPPPQFQL